MKEKLILKSNLSLGDIVVMTGAVRDLHQLYPGIYETDVRTCFPGVWENNPYVSPIQDDDPHAKTMTLQYNLINRSNQLPIHFLHGYSQDLGSRLGLNLYPTAFRGDIHISSTEKSWLSQVHETTGFDTPFWIVAAGGKFDFTIKWWSTERYQKVVDHFAGRLLFVQVGAAEHHHPPLNGVLDLRGKTDPRQLIRLVYHSAGVLSPVTSLMHLAAAVPSKDTKSLRPCVVIAGGREPAHWEQYPGHQFLHTIGSLDCCSEGGCWKSRVFPLNDGDEKDSGDGLCVSTVGNLPECMAMVSPDHVIDAIESYLFKGRGGRLDPWEAKRLQGVTGWSVAQVRKYAAKTDPELNRGSWKEDQPTDLTPRNAVRRTLDAVRSVPEYPDKYSGRGIVICGGGIRYLPSIWVNISMLRRVGCTLEIELWHMPGELPSRLKTALWSFGVQCIDASLNRADATGISGGWHLKTYSILNSNFKEVLYLDADNMAVCDPEYLFDSIEFRENGAVLWPDYGRIPYSDSAWEVCGVHYRDEPEVESGQILVDKQRCWEVLNLAHWYNINSAFFYRYFMGDKETFHFAFRFLNRDYTMPTRGIRNLADCVMCQHDFDGNRLFQHRNLDKWSIDGSNKKIAGFQRENECFSILGEFSSSWAELISAPFRWDPKLAIGKQFERAESIIRGKWLVHFEGARATALKFQRNGYLTVAKKTMLLYWNLEGSSPKEYLVLSGRGGEMGRMENINGLWRGTLRLGFKSHQVTIHRPTVKPDRKVNEERKELIRSRWAYRIVDRSQRSMTFGRHGEFVQGGGELEHHWDLQRTEGGVHLVFFNCQGERTVTLSKTRKMGKWVGQFQLTGAPVALLCIDECTVNDESADPERVASKCVSYADTEREWYTRSIKILGEGLRYHRKQWEFAVTVAPFLRQRRGRRADFDRILVVGSPEDPIVDALASRGYYIDWAYNDQTLKSEGGRDSIQVRTSFKSQLYRRRLTDPDAFWRQVTIRHLREVLEGDSLGQYRFVLYNGFPLEVQKTPQYEVEETLLDSLFSGLSDCQLILVGEVKVELDSNRQPKRVLGEDLLKLRDRLRGREMEIELDFSIGSSCIDSFIDIPPHESDHHYFLRKSDGFVWTSFAVRAYPSSIAPLGRQV